MSGVQTHNFSGVEKIEDTKEVIRSHKSKMERQDNGQKRGRKD